MKKIDSTTGRFYEIEQGIFYPSATTILSVRPLEAGLKLFFQTHTKEEADKLLKEAGMQGSKIHHTIELIMKKEIIMPSGFTPDQLDKTNLISDEDFGDKELLDYLKREFSEREDRMMKGFLNWWEVFKPETIESEKIIFSKKYKYAGTLDWAGVIQVKGKPVICIIDWKTGKGLYKSYDLQVSAYLHAYNEMLKGKKKVKRPKKAYLLQLGINKCGYKFQEAKDIKKDFKRFLHTLETFKDIYPDAKPGEDYKFLPEYKL